MSQTDLTYNELLRTLLRDGDRRGDRTGTGTRAVFGHQMRFDLSEEFPLLTTKKVWWKGIVEELLWFLRGSTNARELQDKGVHIWDDWADEDGELGPIYGRQWRNWEGVDQIKNVVHSLRASPHSRRHIVTAWNPAEIDDMALPPCHCLFQFDVSSDGRLSCQLYQRSADVFIGVPFNIASYALLTLMMAQVCGLKPGEFVWTGGNVHLYRNHVEQATRQLGRAPRPAPKVLLNPFVTVIDRFTTEDIQLRNYAPHPSIKAEVAV